MDALGFPSACERNSENMQREILKTWRDKYKKEVGEKMALEGQIQKKKWVRKWRDTSEKEAGGRVEEHIRKGSG